MITIECDEGWVLMAISPGWHRPQWSLRTLLLITLAVAVVCSILKTYSWYVHAQSSAGIEWVPYSVNTIARSQKAGIPVVVVYRASHSLSQQIWDLGPFDDPGIVRMLKELKAVAMDPWPDILNDNLSDRDAQTVQQAVRVSRWQSADFCDIRFSTRRHSYSSREGNRPRTIEPNSQTTPRACGPHKP